MSTVVSATIATECPRTFTPSATDLLDVLLAAEAVEVVRTGSPGRLPERLAEPFSVRRPVLLVYRGLDQLADRLTGPGRCLLELLVLVVGDRDLAHEVILHHGGWG